MPDPIAVLAEPHRRRLLELLSAGEQNVSELATHFPVTRPAISQHLAVLTGAGLVAARRQGRFRYYRLRPEGMAALRAALDRFWTRELEQLAHPHPRPRGEVRVAEKSVVVPLDPDQTFAMLTEPERLRRWQVVAARVDLRAGGSYRWTVIPGHTAAGTVTEVDPGRRLVLTWGWEDDTELPPEASTVTITLEPVAGGTLVRLVHEGLSEEQAANHLRGWTHYLDRLVRAANAGDAGPDDRAESVSAYDPLTAAEAALAACDRVLFGLRPEDATAPTPCRHFTAEQLVDHLIGSLVAIGAAAGAVTAPDLAGPAELRVAEAAERAITAWRRRGLDGMVRVGGQEAPAPRIAAVLSVELLVHGWDLATATRQQVSANDQLARYVLERARELVSPQARDGEQFGPELAAGPDATDLDRLVAFTGRSAG